MEKEENTGERERVLNVNMHSIGTMSEWGIIANEESETLLNCFVNCLDDERGFYFH